MPRKPRLHVPGGFYHVILRGNARRNIYADEADRLLWQQLIAEGIERWEHRIHAYCWMTNHVHMAVQAAEAPLAGFIGSLASRYARAFNRKYKRSGHLFERRYRAIIVQEDKYLLELVRYIHQNPLRAAMVSTLDQYRWSSHGAYAGGPCSSFLATDAVLSLLASSLRRARRRYLEYVGATPPASVLQSLRAGSDKDDRILGDDDWRTQSLQSMHSASGWESLDQLIERRCEQYGIGEEMLASPSRARACAGLRARIAMEAVDSDLCSVTEIARRFSRSQPAISQAISRRRRQLQKL